jgi:hypothetical protein
MCLQDLLFHGAWSWFLRRFAPKPRGLDYSPSSSFDYPVSEPFLENPVQVKARSHFRKIHLTNLFLVRPRLSTSSSLFSHPRWLVSRGLPKKYRDRFICLDLCSCNTSRYLTLSKSNFEPSTATSRSPYTTLSSAPC